MSGTRRSMIETPAGKVGVMVDGPEAAGVVVVLGHGAGSGMESDFMSTIARGLANAMTVMRFNFPYIEAGRRAPDRPPVLEETFRQVAATARSAGTKLVLGGKSLGGRIASQVVAGGEPADGLLVLGYPLHPPGKPDRLRVEHLPEIGVPTLFVEGTRDPFCPRATFERVLTGMPIDASVAWIDDGDHSFKVRASSGRTTEDAWNEVVRVATEWIGAL